MITVNSFVLPAYWASYLINNNASGLNDTDKANCDNWRKENNPGNCVDCSDESFFGTFNGLGCDLLQYTFYS